MPLAPEESLNKSEAIQRSLKTRSFHGLRHAEGRALVEVRRKHLHSYRQLRGRGAAGHRYAADARETRRYRVDVGQIHGQRIASLLAQLESRRGRGGEIGRASWRERV